jgi:hypothetical protein
MTDDDVRAYEEIVAAANEKRDDRRKVQDGTQSDTF